MKESVDIERSLKVLRQSTLFGALEEEKLRKLVTECTPIYIKKSETIDYDDDTKYLYIIIDGRLKVTQTDPNTGRSITLFLLSRGDVFDIFTLLDNKEHVVFPIAIDALYTLRTPLQHAREWLCAEPSLAQRFLPYLGEMMRHLEDFSQSLVFDDTITRLSKLILHHAQPKQNKNDDHYPVRLIHNLSHESLAEMIGSVRSVVSTQIHKLKEEEIILSSRGHMAIKNLEKLIRKSDQIGNCICKNTDRKPSSKKNP